MKLHSYFREDEDILLLNTQYVRSDRQNNKPGVLYLTYRDNKTKEKKVRRVERPKVETFITKREYRTYPTAREYMPMEKLDSYLVEYEKLPFFVRKMAEEDGRDKELVEISKEYPKEIFKYRHSYYADEDINDYAISSYALSNLCENRNISKAYLDIESDIYQKSETEINDGKAPINAVSVVIPYDQYGVKYEHPKVYTVLLRNHAKYKEQEYFENHLDEFIEQCHREFDDKYNTPEFIVKVYDDEIVMLRNLFALLHRRKPDFIEIWNMSYDIPAIIKRLTYLNENPLNYFCHPDFDRPYYRYNYDNIYKNDFKNKSESFECTSYSMWIDQMLNYANKRRAKADYGGNSLDNVATIEIGAEKRRFKSPDTRVFNAAEKEYWNFALYSINDVLLQYGIDEKTGDTDTIYSLGIESGTRMHKAQKQSVYHKNTFLVEYVKKGLVPWNNHNISYIKDEDPERDPNDPDQIALSGALVGDPTNNSHEGIVINDERSKWLFKYAADEDFKAMYPNIKLKNNISASTQIGRIIIDEKIFANENPLHDEKFMRATKLMEDVESKNPILIGKWMHLPNMTEIIDDYDKTYHNDEKVETVEIPEYKYVRGGKKKNKKSSVNTSTNKSEIKMINNRLVIHADLVDLNSDKLLVEADLIKPKNNRLVIHADLVDLNGGI